MFAAIKFTADREIRQLPFFPNEMYNVLQGVATALDQDTAVIGMYSRYLQN